MNLLYQKFDELLLVRKEVIREVAALTEKIKVKSDLYQVKYSSAFDGLGPLCPSFIIDKITGGYKKGRLLSKKPKSDHYALIYFNSQDGPVYFEVYNSFGCDVTYYYFKWSNLEWVVPFISHSNQEYPSDAYCIRREEGRIIEFTALTDYSLWQEEYVYSKEENSVICNQYYYVPKLKGSSKDILPGENGSPVQVMKNDIAMENGKVVEIIHYERRDGCDVETYRYTKK